MSAVINYFSPDTHVGYNKMSNKISFYIESSNVSSYRDCNLFFFPNNSYTGIVVVSNKEINKF
jgi:hypothetical protein